MSGVYERELRVKTKSAVAQLSWACFAPRKLRACVGGGRRHQRCSSFIAAAVEVTHGWGLKMGGGLCAFFFDFFSDFFVLSQLKTE
jgi:hypothetical protein